MRDYDRTHLMSGTLDTTGSGGQESVLSGVAHVFQPAAEPPAPAETATRWTPSGWVDGPAQTPLFDDDGQPNPAVLPEQGAQEGSAAEGSEDGDPEAVEDDGSEQDPANPGGPVVPEADAAKSRRPPATGKGRQVRGPKAAG